MNELGMVALSSYIRFLLVTILLAFGSFVKGQDIKLLEKEFKDQYGAEKLQTLLTLTDYLDGEDSKKCLKYARQAEQLANNLAASENLSDDDWLLVVQAQELYGKIQYKRGKYLVAKQAFETAQELASKRKSVDAQMADSYLSKIDSLAAEGLVKDNPFKNVLRNIDIDAAINNSSHNLEITVAIQTAKVAEKVGDTATAIKNYEKALELLSNTKATERAEQIREKIASYRQLQTLEVPIIEIPEYDTLELTTLPIVRLNKDSIEHVVRNAESRVEELKAQGDYQAALNYYQQYITLQMQLQQDSLKRAELIREAEAEMERLQQENELADLNLTAIRLEKQAEEDQKNVLLLVTTVVILAIGVIIFFFVARIRKHKALTRAYKHLDQAKSDLQKAEQHISRLLEQQVSPDIASALIEQEADIKRKVVTVMFLDIRDFTPKAEQMAPNELIEYQNKVFGFMIEIVNEHHGNINQFMGDGFMATFGAPKSYGNDAGNAVRAARMILNKLAEMNAEDQIPKTEVGIGINTGEVVTGNVGTDSRKQFSITGSTVIIAARIEQLNKQFQSNLIIADSTMKMLNGEVEDLGLNYHEESVKLKGRTEREQIYIVSDSSNR